MSLSLISIILFLLATSQQLTRSPICLIKSLHSNPASLSACWPRLSPGETCNRTEGLQSTQTIFCARCESCHLSYAANLYV